MARPAEKSVAGAVAGSGSGRGFGNSDTKIQTATAARSTSRAAGVALVFMDRRAAQLLLFENHLLVHLAHAAGEVVLDGEHFAAFRDGPLILHGVRIVAEASLGIDHQGV